MLWASRADAVGGQGDASTASRIAVAVDRTISILRGAGGIATSVSAIVSRLALRRPEFQLAPELGEAPRMTEVRRGSIGSRDACGSMVSKEISQETVSGRAGEPTLRASLQQIYDLYRTSLLNVKYYGYKVTVANRCNTAAEIVVVVGSATSGVSGWAVWSWGHGQEIWLAFAAAATLIAAVKPVLQINKKIELYGKLFGGHHANYLATKALVERVQAQRAVTPGMQAVYRAIQGRYLDLARDDEPNPSRKLLARFQSEVNVQIPPQQLWWGD
jgi:hypothetical protein